MKALNPNSMIQGRYLIVQPIGKGGMGEVYLAVDQRLGSAVALKRTFFSEDSTLGTAFEREARILARLRHPVLPKVIDHFSENGDQFLVMEHISGDDIAKRIESADKPFPLSWVMFWSDQMLDALAYLHSHEPPIVHRDIKPQNLKLTDDNHIVLLDFGLSKDFDSNSGGLNSASVAGYSPHFASMEQIRGTGTDARSDLYSLAATLYQMLTNTMPPDALTRADSMLGGKGDPIRPLNELNPEITPPISDVILKAVAIRQEERYDTAAEMQKALRRAFNKDKSDVEVKPESEPPVHISAAENPTLHSNPVVIDDAPSEVPEMETQIRLDTPVPLDATMRMTPVAVVDVQPSELKTAVYSVDSISSIKESEIETPLDSENLMAAAATNSSAVAANFTAQPAAVAAISKKTGSKTGLVVGLLISLVVLAGVIGAAGWFLVNRSNPVTGGTPSLVPANSATPASTPVIAAETGTNSNANITAQVVPETGNSLANSNTNTATSLTTTSKPTTPVGAKTTPPKATQPQGEKSTPKPKAKDERTVIVQ